MGLLDALFPGSDGGGLLDFLKQNAQWQPSPVGLPSDTAQYGAMPQMAQQPAIGGAQAAPQPPMPAPQAMPQPMPQATPQPAAAAQAQTSIPPEIASLLQPAQHQGGLGAALQGALANIAGGPLGMLGGAFAGGMGMGHGTEQQQKAASVNARYLALQQAGIPKEKALLAAIDPEHYKSITDDAFSSDKFQFQQMPDGTIVRENAKTGEAVPAYKGAVKPEFGIIKKDDGTETYGWRDPSTRSVYDINGQPLQPGAAAPSSITGPNGQQIAIPAGADRKTFVNEITKTNADAATGKLTEAQAKASAFAARMEQAEQTLKSVEGEGTSYVGKALDSAPLIGGTALTNSMQSNGYQKYRQAAGNFVTAMLRQESGAAISNSEFSRYEKELLPQPGDGADVLKQKREARAAAIGQMRKAAGPGYQSPGGGNAGVADPLGIR